MRLQLKRLMLKFQLEYDARPPTQTSIAAGISAHVSNINRILNNPESNITTSTLEKLVQFLYGYYEGRCEQIERSLLLHRIVSELIEFDVSIECNKQKG